MIVAEAREWIGTPWMHQASLKGKGADCIGLVSGVATAMGFPEGAAFRADIRFRGYGRQPDPRMVRKALAEYLDVTTSPQMGDIIIMRFEKDPQHFGILSSSDYMIHAYAQARKVVENRINEDWRARIVGYYKFKGL